MTADQLLARAAVLERTAAAAELAGCTVQARIDRAIAAELRRLVVCDHNPARSGHEQRRVDMEAKMELSIEFSKQEAHPARPSAITAGLRAADGQFAPWDADAREIADRFGVALLGAGCLAREVGMARMYQAPGASEWHPVKVTTYR